MQEGIRDGILHLHIGSPLYTEFEGTLEPKTSFPTKGIFEGQPVNVGAQKLTGKSEGHEVLNGNESEYQAVNYYLLCDPSI